MLIPTFLVFNTLCSFPLFSSLQFIMFISAFFCSSIHYVHFRFFASSIHYVHVYFSALQYIMFISAFSVLQFIMYISDFLFIKSLCSFPLFRFINSLYSFPLFCSSSHYVHFRFFCSSIHYVHFHFFCTSIHSLMVSTYQHCFISHTSSWVATESIQSHGPRDPQYDFTLVPCSLYLVYFCVVCLLF